MSYDGFQALRVALDAGVATVTIDHGAINLFDLTLIGELDRLGRELEADDAVRAVVLVRSRPRRPSLSTPICIVVAPRARRASDGQASTRVTIITPAIGGIVTATSSSSAATRACGAGVPADLREVSPVSGSVGMPASMRSAMSRVTASRPAAS